MQAKNSLSHHGRRQAKAGARKRHSLKVPRILSLRRAKNPRHGILIYSNVQSRSRGTRVIHTVTGAKRGRKKLFHCSCESASFNPRVSCIHILAVQRRLRQRRSA
jgi:hypothetical protein